VEGACHVGGYQGKKSKTKTTRAGLSPRKTGMSTQPTINQARKKKNCRGLGTQTGQERSCTWPRPRTSLANRLYSTYFDYKIVRDGNIAQRTPSNLEVKTIESSLDRRDKIGVKRHVETRYNILKVGLSCQNLLLGARCAGRVRQMRTVQPKKLVSVTGKKEKRNKKQPPEEAKLCCHSYQHRPRGT